MIKDFLYQSKNAIQYSQGILWWIFTTKLQKPLPLTNARWSGLSRMVELSPTFCRALCSQMTGHSCCCFSICQLCLEQFALHFIFIYLVEEVPHGTLWRLYSCWHVSAVCIDTIGCSGTRLWQMLYWPWVGKSVRCTFYQKWHDMTGYTVVYRHQQNQWKNMYFQTNW